MVAKKILSCALICATLILMGCDGEYFNWNLERINPNDNPGTGGTSGTGGTGGTSGSGGTGGSTGTGGTGGTGGGTAVTILNDLNQIQFVDNNIGYAVGTGVVIKSVDGGIKWVKINTSNSLEFTAIYFVNESIGYLGGNDQYYSYLFKTVDGGLTWQQLNRYWFQNERNEVMSIFASPTGDRAVAMINKYPNATQVFGHMVYSSNGGSTWNTLQASRQAGFNTADLLNGSLFIGGNAYWTGTAYRTSVYTSTFLANGSLDLLENTATQVNNNPISIYELDMVSNVGFATTSDGQFAISSDSGRNWTLKPLSGSNSGLDLTAILFTSNTAGYIGTSSGLVLMTQDAGLSWSTVFQGAIEITDLALRPDGKIAAAGKRGFIRIIN
jgi:hypothetical protein